MLTFFFFVSYPAFQISIEHAIDLYSLPSLDYFCCFVEKNAFLCDLLVSVYFLAVEIVQPVRPWLPVLRHYDMLMPPLTRQPLFPA